MSDSGLIKERMSDPPLMDFSKILAETQSESESSLFPFP